MNVAMATGINRINRSKSQGNKYACRWVSAEISSYSSYSSLAGHRGWWLQIECDMWATLHQQKCMKLCYRRMTGHSEEMLMVCILSVCLTASRGVLYLCKNKDLMCCNWLITNSKLFYYTVKLIASLFQFLFQFSVVHQTVFSECFCCISRIKLIFSCPRERSTHRCTVRFKPQPE